MSFIATEQGIGSYDMNLYRTLAAAFQVVPVIAKPKLESLRDTSQVIGCQIDSRSGSLLLEIARTVSVLLARVGCCWLAPLPPYIGAHPGPGALGRPNPGKWGTTGLRLDSIPGPRPADGTRLKPENIPQQRHRSPKLLQLRSLSEGTSALLSSTHTRRPLGPCVYGALQP
jgi:hypothetical protein